MSIHKLMCLDLPYHSDINTQIVQPQYGVIIVFKLLGHTGIGLKVQIQVRLKLRWSHKDDCVQNVRYIMHASHYYLTLLVLGWYKAPPCLPHFCYAPDLQIFSLHFCCYTPDLQYFHPTFVVIPLICSYFHATSIVMSLICSYFHPTSVMSLICSNFHSTSVMSLWFAAIVISLLLHPWFAIISYNLLCHFIAFYFMTSVSFCDIFCFNVLTYSVSHHGSSLHDICALPNFMINSITCPQILWAFSVSLHDIFCDILCQCLCHVNTLQNMSHVYYMCK